MFEFVVIANSGEVLANFVMSRSGYGVYFL